MPYFAFAFNADKTPILGTCDMLIIDGRLTLDNASSVAIREYCKRSRVAYFKLIKARRIRDITLQQEDTAALIRTSDVMKGVKHARC